MFKDSKSNSMLEQSTNGISELLPEPKKFAQVNMKTMIRVTPEVRDRIKRLGFKGEDYTEVLDRILKQVET